MGWEVAAQSGAVVLAVGAIGGLLKLTNRVTAVEKDMGNLEKNCNQFRENCGPVIHQEVVDIRKDVVEHHSKGPHLTDDFKAMVVQNFESLAKRLDGIEAFLRKNGTKL